MPVKVGTQSRWLALGVGKKNTKGKTPSVIVNPILCEGCQDFGTVQNRIDMCLKSQSKANQKPNDNWPESEDCKGVRVAVSETPHPKNELGKHVLSNKIEATHRKETTCKPSLKSTL